MLEKYAAEIQRLQLANEKAGVTPRTGPLTVRAYADAWLKTREADGNDWKADRGRLAKHVLPNIGDLVLAEVRHKDLMRKLRALKDDDGKIALAPRTVRNIYAVVAAMFRDATNDEEIAANPCRLKKKDIGAVADRDLEWRPGAKFSHEEAEIMISHPDIPSDRRMAYAFGLLAGLRPGESAALRFRHWDPSAKPLGRLLIAYSYNTKAGVATTTKTEVVKSIGCGSSPPGQFQ